MVGWKELMIVLLIVLLVFGTRKLSTIGKDLGQAVGGFRKGMAGGGDAAGALPAGGEQRSAEKEASEP